MLPSDPDKSHKSKGIIPPRKRQRNKDVARKIEIACLRHSTAALNVLVDAMDKDRTPGIDYKLRIIAAQEVLNRAYGKARVSIDATVTDTNTDQLIDLIRKARDRVHQVIETEYPMPQITATTSPEVH